MTDINKEWREYLRGKMVLPDERANQYIKAAFKHLKIAAQHERAREFTLADTQRFYASNSFRAAARA